MALGTERRQYHRYSGESLNIHHEALSEQAQTLPSALKCIDFNRYGMALESHAPMPVGEQLSFTIVKDEIMSIQVHATVCYRLKDDQRFIFGVKFYTQGNDRDSTEFFLTAIETLLALD